MTLRTMDLSPRPSMNFAAILLLLLAFLTSVTHAAEVISGVPRIVDGDTLVIETTKMRLASIDAPESDQVCLDENRKRWTCGIEARDRLAAHIGNRPTDCAPTGLGTYGRMLATCTLEKILTHGWCDKDGHWHLFDTQNNTLQMKKPLAVPVVVCGAVPLLHHGIGVIGIVKRLCSAQLAFRFQHKRSY